VFSWQRAAIFSELVALAAALVAVVISLMAAASGRW
jgi:ABC-type spermidine/putrescine transport system permease subunit II